MRRSEMTALRRRWTPSMIGHVRHQLAVQGHRPVRDAHGLVSPWPDAPASMTDRRGIEVGAEGLAIDHLTITRVVLSFSRGQTSCFQSEIHDSRFDAVELAGQPRFTRRFERSSFRGADLTRVAVGPHVIDCDFTDARAPRLESAPDTASERCRFDGADLRGAVFRHATFIDCSFVGAKFSEATVFDRCSPHRTALDSGDARLTRVMRDGVSLPDQWAGEAEWNATEDRYLDRYRRAFLAGDAETMSLDPTIQIWSRGGEAETDDRAGRGAGRRRGDTLGIHSPPPGDLGGRVGRWRGVLPAVAESDGQRPGVRDPGRRSSWESARDTPHGAHGMVLKVGPIRSASEARMARGADVISVRLSDERHPDAARAITTTTYAEIRASTDAEISMEVDPLSIDRDLVDRLAPDYLEWAPTDPEKTDLLARELASLAPLGVPWICTGMWVARDDLWLLDHEAHLSRLVEAGARFIQIEMDSLIAPVHRIDPGDAERIEDLVARFPVLVTDGFTTSLPISPAGAAGVYLELGEGGARPMTFAFSTAVRLMRTRR
jgi:hypothetical protein